MDDNWNIEIKADDTVIVRISIRGTSLRRRLALNAPVILQGPATLLIILNAIRAVLRGGHCLSPSHMNCESSIANLGIRAPADPEMNRLIASTLLELKSNSLTSFAIAVAAIPVLQGAAHCLVCKLAQQHRRHAGVSITDEQRVVGSHHVVELIVGVVGTPIMFAVTRRLMFCTPAETYAPTSSLLNAGIGVGLAVCAMYSCELAGRLSKTRPLTALHHLLTIAVILGARTNCPFCSPHRHRDPPRCSPRRKWTPPHATHPAIAVSRADHHGDQRAHGYNRLALHLRCGRGGSALRRPPCVPLPQGA